MVAVTAGLVIDLNDDLNGTTAVGFRRALAVLFKQTTPGVADSGRLGADHFMVLGNPGAMKYSVSSGGIVLTRDATGGAYVIGMPQSVEVDTDPTDGVNPRWDRIYVRQPDPAIDGGATDVSFIIDVAVGVPAATPELPALPDGAFELARKYLAADATNTVNGVEFSDIAPTTGLNFGGVIGIGQGGTGATNKAGARAALGITSGTATPSNSSGNDGDIYFKII